MADPTFIGVPLPEYERRREAPQDETTGGTTITPWSAEQLAADEERKRLLAESEVNAATVKAAADTGTANDVKAADDLLAEKVRQGELDRTAMQKSNEQIAAAREHVSRKQKEFESYKPQGFVHKGDTWGNALRGLAASLGDAGQVFASVATGHGVPKIDTVGDIIANDLRQSEAHIAKMKDEEAMARTGLADATEARSQLLADRKLAAAAAYDRLASIASQRKAAQGFDNNNIKRDEAVAAARAGAHKERQEAADLHASKVTKNWTHRGEQTAETFRNPSAGTAKPTERQSTDAFLGKNLARALDTVEKNGPLPADTLEQMQDQELGMTATDKTASSGVVGSFGAKLSRGIGLSPRSKTQGMSPQHQETVTAFDVAKEMVARKLSGGAIVTDEDRQNAEKYIPHAGDSPELIAHKNVVLRDMSRDMLKLSGPAGETLSSPTGTAQPATAAKPPAPTQPPPFVGASAAPPTAPEAPASPRDRVIQLLKSGKVGVGLQQLKMKQFGIKPEELQ